MSDAASPGLIDSFRQKAREWAADVVALYNTPVPKELEAEKNSLIGKAKKIKETVESILGTVDDLNFGLGFLPLLIPAAVVAGASAAIYYWYTDYSEFKQKLEYHKSLVASGESPQSATAIIDSITGGGSIFSGKKPLIILAIIGGAYLLFKKKR